MNVKPDELANTCAIFTMLRAGHIARFQLESYLLKCQLLDSRANPSQIIDECILYGLLTEEENEFTLTNRGRQLAKRQNSITSSITDSARDFMLRNVYLDISIMTLPCKTFLFAFRVDPVEGTFVYDRSAEDSSEIIKWLCIFNKVGLIQVSDIMALVKPIHLGIFNDFLAQMRGLVALRDEKESNQSNEIGELAEQHAVQYEIRRLQGNGHPDLALLVQRISTIDQSAGYDVISRKGVGAHPENALFIEVKGTSKSELCFVWTRNERHIAEQEGANYWIYAFTNVDLATGLSAGPIRIYDPIRRLQKLGYILEPLDVQVYRKSNADNDSRKAAP